MFKGLTNTNSCMYYCFCSNVCIIKDGMTNKLVVKVISLCKIAA